VNYGINRLIEDLINLGFNEVISIKDANNANYALISKFEIPAGSFSGKIIELAIPAPDQYPQMCGPSIHILASPILVPFGNVPGVRNVIQSPLGDSWQYWSYQFSINPVNPTAVLISQINEIFKRN